MARKKYARDYRLNESLDERGRIRTEAEYIGVYYRYVSGAETARGALKTLLGFTVLAWALFLCSLLPHSTASLTMYVMLPYLFTALPLGMMTAALLQLRAAGERLDHRTADLAGERVPACSLWMLLLPGPFFPATRCFCSARSGQASAAGSAAAKVRCSPRRRSIGKRKFIIRLKGRLIIKNLLGGTK